MDEIIEGEVVRKHVEQLQPAGDNPLDKAHHETPQNAGSHPSNDTDSDSPSSQQLLATTRHEINAQATRNPVPNDLVSVREQSLQERTKEQEIRELVQQIVRTAKERFLDTDEAITLSLDNPGLVPGYISRIVVGNPRGDVEVAISHTVGLTLEHNNLYESLGGQEFDVTYRQLRGPSSLPPVVRRRLNGYEFGSIYIPSEGEGWHAGQEAYSRKFTMNGFSRQQWEEGYTSTTAWEGSMKGQKAVDVTLDDYRAILDAVKKGKKLDDLTRLSSGTLHKQILKEFHQTTRQEAEAVLQERIKEIMRSERTAIDSAKRSNEAADNTSDTEKDHPGPDSFSTAQERLYDVAHKFSGEDERIIGQIGDRLAHFGSSLDIIHTMLSLKDEAQKNKLLSMLHLPQGITLTPYDMYKVAEQFTDNMPYDLVNEIGIVDDIKYGAPVDRVFVPDPNNRYRNLTQEIGQPAKMAVLESLGFLRPGESLAERMMRMKGEPRLGQTESGESTGSIQTFRSDSASSEAIYWDPYRTSSRGNIRITSPLFGPNIVVMVDMDMHIVNTENGDELVPMNDNISSAVLRVEGSNIEESGEAMIQVSKDLHTLRLPEENPHTT